MRKDRLASVALVAGLLAVTAVAYEGLGKGRRSGSGPTLIEAKDFIADILPPPLFLVETHALSLQLMAEEDGTRQGALVRQLESLKRQHDRQTEHWRAHLPPGELRQQFIDVVQPASERYLTFLFDRFVPQMRSPAVARPARDASAELHALFLRHHAAIDRLVELSREAELAAAKEEAARGALHRWALLLVSTLALFAHLAAKRRGSWLRAGAGTGGEVASNFAWRFSGRLAVYMHGVGSPHDQDWNRMLGEVEARSRLGAHRVVVFTAGGMPTSAQRERLTGLTGSSPTPTIIVGDTMKVRFVGLLMRLLNPVLRFYAPDDLPRAYRYLELRDQERIWLDAAMAEMASELGRNGNAPCAGGRWGAAGTGPAPV